MSATTLPIAVIGAGAAGLMAAITAARRGHPVVLLERTADGGRKILISGGGRCNVLPSQPAPDRFVTDSSPHTLRKILTSWELSRQREFFEALLGGPLVLESETGKLFPPGNRARDVRDGLVRAAEEAGARIWWGAKVVGLSRADGGWRVEVEGAPALDARAVVIATGGLSVPKTGSDGTGLSIVAALGHEVHTTYPALTPLTADPHPHAELAGVSGVVTIRAGTGKRAFRTRGGMVVTHRGWSGPAVLDVSHLAVRARMEGRQQELLVQWSARGPSEWEQVLLGGTGTLRGTVSEAMPRRLAATLLREAGVDPETPLATLRRKDRQATVRGAHALRPPVDRR